MDLNEFVKNFDEIAKDMGLYCYKHGVWYKQDWSKPKTCPYCPECRKEGNMPVMLAFKNDGLKKEKK